jgi:CRP/FNR family transcriptional regulator
MSNALPQIDKMRGVELFGEMTGAELEVTAKCMISKQYPAGQTLFFEGMPGELMYVVLSGQLEIYKTGPEGERRIALVGPGEFSGEGSLILEGKRSTNCRVTQDSELLVLTRKYFHDLTISHPAISTKLLTGFLKANIIRLRNGNQRMALV